MSTNEESISVSDNVPATPVATVPTTANNGDATTPVATVPTPTSDPGRRVAATAAWPYSCPPTGADFFMTIVCGNTHCHWAIHEGDYEKDFHPLLFWK